MATWTDLPHVAEGQSAASDYANALSDNLRVVYDLLHQEWVDFTPYVYQRDSLGPIPHTVTEARMRNRGDLVEVRYQLTMTTNTGDASWGVQVVLPVVSTATNGPIGWGSYTDSGGGLGYQCVCELASVSYRFQLFRMDTSAIFPIGVDPSVSLGIGDTLTAQVFIPVT
jgi:hypothetical protein